MCQQKYLRGQSLSDFCKCLFAARIQFNDYIKSFISYLLSSLKLTNYINKMHYVYLDLDDENNYDSFYFVTFLKSVVSKRSNRL